MVSLEKAEKSLKESEYERYLDDQQRLLDDLMTDTEQWVNERLDNLDGLVAEAVNATNQNAETISNTIHEATNAYGYKLSDQMEAIWDYEENAIDGVVTIVSIYGDVLHGVGEELLTSNTGITNAINGGTTNVINAINGLNVSIQNIISTLNSIANNNKESIAQAQNAVVSGQSNSNISTTTPTAQNQSTSSQSTGGSGGVNGYKAYIGSEYIGSYATKPGAEQAAKNEVARRAEEEAKKAAEKDGGRNATVIYNNTKMGVGSDLTSKIKIKAYASGTTNAKRGINLVAEKGREIIVDNDGNITLADGMQLYPFKGGETVFNAQDTSDILNGGLMPLSMDGVINKAPNMSGIIKNAGNNIEQDININFSLPNVTDANSLINELQHDKRFEKIIQSMTADRMLGKNSLNKYKY